MRAGTICVPNSFKEDYHAGYVAETVLADGRHVYYSVYSTIERCEYKPLKSYKFLTVRVK